MKHPIVVGMQYGDEGKGKITDYIAEQADWVIRFNGGSNAGHTLYFDGKKVVTHCIPSGILYSHCKNYIGAACVINPKTFTQEVEDIKSSGFSVSEKNLKIDFRAHVTFPIHLALEELRENSEKTLGTTKKGIGTTYLTKVDRTGVRVGDLYNESGKDRLQYLVDFYAPLLGSEASRVCEETLMEYETAKELFKPFACMDHTFFYDVAKKEKCLLEGAQAVLLDVDHGSYPFVTSSSTLAGSAAAGVPFPLRNLGLRLGVAKAYMTRVGEGPFETEITGDYGDHLRGKGGEFGATTGRPRKVGWMNLDELSRAVRLSDSDHIVLTKADVLCGEKEVKALSNGEWHNFAGWDEVGTAENLNSNFKKYIDFIEEKIGISVAAVGTGPARNELVWLKKIESFWE